MSDGDKPAGPDDDGWGAAADKLEANEEKAAEPVATADWKDPANLDERVAALRASEQMPATVLPPTNDVPVTAPQSDTQATVIVDDSLSDLGDSKNADSAASPNDKSADSSFVAESSVDTPQWVAPTAPEKSAEVQQQPTPPSDMLAAAAVIAKKNSEPKAKAKAKKRQEAKEPRTGSGLTRTQLKRLIAVAVLLVVSGVVAILGWLNSQNYYLVCGTQSIRAEQGRFWPSGQSALPGPAFRAISVPSDVLCQSKSFDNRWDLENAFLAALLEQSTTLLANGGAEQVSIAEQQLEQALLLTRDPKRSKERELAERLKGDVSYWRGAAEVERAVESLQVGATSFEEAAAKRPRHKNDANAWAEHARYIAEEIEKGPRALRKNEAPKEKPHFEGLSPPTVAPTPETPERQIDAPTIDAGLPTVPPADADAPPIDAALPRGGVLL